MAQPVYTNNLTDTTRLDGVYIFEQSPPGYVQGVGSNVVGILGDFDRGPVNTVVAIGSSAEFLRIFGGYGVAPSGQESTWKGYSGFRAVAGKAWPAPLLIVRAQRTSMVKASLAIPLVTHVEADSVVTTQGRTLIAMAAHAGNYGNRIAVTITEPADSSLTNGFSLLITLDDRSEVIANLHAAMTSQDLLAAIQNAGLNIIDSLRIADDDGAEADEWPAAAYLTGGSDGTVSAQGWTDAVDKLVARRDLNILCPAQPDGTTLTAATLNAYIKSAVAPTSGSQAPVIAVLSGPAGDDIDAAATAAALLRSDRIVYAWPHRYQVFPAANPQYPEGRLLVPSNDVIACALANIDPVLDITASQGAQYINAATAGLEYDDLGRDDYIAAKDAGICALELDNDLGFRAVSGVTTLLTPGSELIMRRRTADHLNASIGRSLKFYQGQPITDPWKDEVVGTITDFLRDQQRILGGIQRVVAFSIDIDSVNDESTLGQGIFRIKMEVRIPSPARYIVLLSRVGPTVQVTEAA
ncbi:hypothetical protein GC173_11575 [bacterium]|nr:hypothetical protein [bacterium]